MKYDKLKTYLLGISLMIFLFLALLFRTYITKQILAIVLFVFMLLAMKLIGKRREKSIYLKSITIVLVSLGIIYVILLYALGLYFGYYESPVKFGFFAIKNYIIPLGTIIICSEVIRYIFLSREEKFNKTIILVSMTLVEIILYLNNSLIDSVDILLALIGFITFSAIANNLLFNYLSVGYGCVWSTVIYRIITTMYYYIFPLTPNLMTFLESIIRMIYPYLIYIVVESTYGKRTFVVAESDRKRNFIVNTIFVICSTLIILLVSCNFKYGLLVIGSTSMTGTINKGDIVLYKTYNPEKDEIKPEDIIIFEKNDMKIIHRVQTVKSVNGAYRYYTKGDANAQSDEGYSTDDTVFALYKGRIPYIGWFTLWINDLFK